MTNLKKTATDILTIHISNSLLPSNILQVIKQLL